MKWLIVLLVFIKQSVGITEIRYHFEHINQNELHVKKLKQLLSEDVKLSLYVKQAYLASCIMGEANYISNPFDKIHQFNVGKALLELSVNKDSTNLEIHYIRYVIQMHVPAILNYKGHQKVDRLFLISNANKVKTSDAELYQKIILFLKSKANLNEHELIKLKA
jgi:hypothetical protein